MTILTKDSQVNLSLVKEAVKACFVKYPLLQQLSQCQAILEAGLLQSPPSKLALQFNNLFGMKSGKLIKEGTAGVIKLPTKEFLNGKWVTVMAPFLSNTCIEDSFKQHEKLLSELDRYDNLFNAKSFEEVALLIKQDGYATDPKYPVLLMQIYKKYVCRSR